MKTKIANLLAFFVTALVLGVQTFSQGSWIVKKAENEGQKLNVKF